MKPLQKFSLSFLAFLQAIAIFLYCSLVGVFMWAGSEIFGPIQNFLGPLLVLALLVASVLICGLLAFGYPIMLFWDKKDTKGAIKLVTYTAGWLSFFVTLLIVTLVAL